MATTWNIKYTLNTLVVQVYYFLDLFFFLQAFQIQMDLHNFFELFRSISLALQRQAD